MTIDVPVKLHVKQYLLKNVFIEKPYRLNETDPVGIMMLALLEPKKRAGLPLRYHPDRVLKVELGHRTANTYKQWLPPVKARRFNTFIDSLIKAEFKNYVKDMQNKIKDARVDKLIREFEEKYDLENTELSFATLKRMYYRASIAA